MKDETIFSQANVFSLPLWVGGLVIIYVKFQRSPVPLTSRLYCCGSHETSKVGRSHKVVLLVKRNCIIGSTLFLRAFIRTPL